MIVCVDERVCDERVWIAADFVCVYVKRVDCLMIVCECMSDDERKSSIF